MPQLGNRQPPILAGENGAGHGAGQDDLGRLQPILRQDGDSVTSFDAMRLQYSGQPLDALKQLPIAHRAGAIGKRNPFAATPDLLGEQGSDGALGASGDQSFGGCGRVGHGLTLTASCSGSSAALPGGG